MSNITGIKNIELSNLLLVKSGLYTIDGFTRSNMENFSKLLATEVQSPIVYVAFEKQFFYVFHDVCRMTPLFVISLFHTVMVHAVKRLIVITIMHL